MRVLFLQGFVSPQRDYKASDAVGYGITAAEAPSSRHYQRAAWRW